MTGDNPAVCVLPACATSEECQCREGALTGMRRTTDSAWRSHCAPARAVVPMTMGQCLKAGGNDETPGALRLINRPEYCDRATERRGPSAPVGTVYSRPSQ
jgi:hypothetical protein